MNERDADKAALERFISRQSTLDMNTAKAVEFEIAADGRVWLNVDGVCVFRCQHPEFIAAKNNGRVLYAKSYAE